jgi:ribonuclease PH
VVLEKRFSLKEEAGCPKSKVICWAKMKDVQRKHKRNTKQASLEIKIEEQYYGTDKRQKEASCKKR